MHTAAISVTQYVLLDSPWEIRGARATRMCLASCHKTRIWTSTHKHCHLGVARGYVAGTMLPSRGRHCDLRDPPHVAAVSLRVQSCACIRTCVASSLTTQFWPAHALGCIYVFRYNI